MSSQTEVPIFQLLQWRSAIRLEAKGLRNSKGSVFAHAKRRLGISGSREKVVEHITGLIEEYKDENNID